MSNAGAATFNGNLTVNGADVTITSNIIHAGDTDTYFGFNDANTYRIVTGGSEALRVDSSQNVGIGTTSPTGKLEIAATGTNAAPHIKLVEDSDTREFNIYNDGSGNGHLVLADSDDDTPDTEIVLADNGVIQFKTGNTERMTITADGNLGLGDNSPANFSGYVVASLADSTGAILDFKTTGSEGVFARIQGAVNNGLFITNEQNYPIALNTNATERMRVTGAGKVIIGDTASHVDDLLQIETPASGGGHGIQIRRNDSNGDQGIGRIMFGNNNDTDLATVSAITDGQADSARLVFSTQATSGSSTVRLVIDSLGRETNSYQPYTASYDNSNQSVSAVTWTDVAFDTDLETNGTSMRSGTTFTFPVAGVYLVTGVLSVESPNATNYNQFRAVFGSHSQVFLGINELIGSNTYGYDIPINFMVKVSANDTMKLQAFSGSGSLTLRGGAASSHIEVMLMR